MDGSVKTWTCGDCECINGSHQRDDNGDNDRSSTEADNGNQLGGGEKSTQGGYQAKETDMGTATVLEHLRRIIDMIKPCECEKHIRILTDENKKLRDLISTQSAVIRTLRDDYKVFMKEITSLLSARNSPEKLQNTISKRKHAVNVNSAIESVASSEHGSSALVSITDSSISDKKPTGEVCRPRSAVLPDVHPLVPAAKTVNALPQNNRGIQSQSKTFAAVCERTQTPALTIDKVPGRIDNSGATIDMTNEVDGDGFTTVNYSKHRRTGGGKWKPKQVIVGSAEEVECELKAVQNKHWFHIARLPLDTSMDDVREYIIRKFGVKDCICERIVPRNVENATFSSFKVGVDHNSGDVLLTADKWPKGIAVSRWYFFRRKQQTHVNA